MITHLDKEVAGIEPWTEPLYDTLRINWLDLGVKYNSIPFQSDVAIIVTSWHGHLLFLKAVLTSYRMTGKFVVCAYDQPYDCWSSEGGHDCFMPRVKVMVLPHAWVFKHSTYDSDKRNGWFWDIKYAGDIIRQYSNFKYVFCCNGDCILEKPDGIPELITILDDADLMSVSSEKDKIIHTCSVIFKMDAFKAILDHMTERMRVPVLGAQSPERMLTEGVKLLGLKEKLAPKQPLYLDGTVDHYTCYNQESTWKDVIGYRNLWSEFKMCFEERKEPVPIEYVDLYNDGVYFRDNEKNLLFQYYKTRDRRWLYTYWDRAEIEWYDRLFYPLEHYGPEPIYEKE